MQQLQEKVSFSLLREDRVDQLGEQIQGIVKSAFASSGTASRVKDFLHGVWLAHPLHAAVTDVPIGAWTTAFLLDRMESITGRSMNEATSATIGIGIGGAVISAASGIADWSETSGAPRRVGMLHALLNVLALGMFSVSLAQRMGKRDGGKLFTSLGFFTVMASSYLGGDLVYRLGTQVDRNAWRGGPREFTGVMGESELQEGKPTKARAGSISIMLVRQGGMVYALSDNCSHAGCSLSDGEVHGDTVTCPCHGSTYRLEDGTVVRGPAVYAQPHFDVRVEGGQVQVRLKEQD